MLLRPVASRSVPGRLVASLAASLFASACARSPLSGPADELRVAVPYDVVSLDPHLDNTLEGFEQVSNVYEPLVALDRELGVVPALAISWYNPEPSTWVFRLRKGVRFHDGSLLEAADVVHSLTRLRTDESLAMRSPVADVVSVTGEDGAVILRTGRPSAYLLNDLAQVLIIRAGATRESLEAHPNGTGPYAVEGWTPRERLRLRRHEDYWGPRPKFASVAVQMGTGEHATPELQTGRLSIVRVTYPSAERAAAQHPRYRIVRRPSLYLFHLALNVSSPTLPGADQAPNPFRNREVRRAMALGLDRERIAAASSPPAVPTDRIVPRSIFGWGPRAEEPEVVADLAAAARRLLESGGYPHGFETSLHGIGLNARTALPELCSQLARIGIRVRLADSPSAPAFHAALRRQELGLWVVGDAALTGEAGWLLATQFHSVDGVRHLGTDNYGGYSSAEVDRAIEDANVVLKPRERLPLLQKAVRLVEDEYWWIPLYHSQASFVVDRELTFEPRADLYLRYAEVGRAGAGPPDRP